LELKCNETAIPEGQETRFVHAVGLAEEGAGRQGGNYREDSREMSLLLVKEDSQTRHAEEEAGRSAALPVQ